MARKREKALIFASGKPGDGPLTRRVLAEAGDAWVIAADGGALLARHYGLRPEVIIGDMDSLDAGSLTFLEAAGARVLRHPADKAETDLELALKLAAAGAARWLRVFGALGGRIDQTLANVMLLTLPELRGSDARIVAGRQQLWLLRPGTHWLEGAPGDTVSLIPLQGAATGIRSKGLRWPLRDDTLAAGPARGISNVLEAPRASLRLNAGLLLVAHTQGRA